ncbi:Electron transport complex protein RnfG [Marinomonas gallaica]|uniref:Ion-translocating oxidoreductase complex subunit G n=1 Tax=Marinomonas gallaica TaxID=1806667 RepID=A0A1C3JSH7_9GAMM|nr:electron transport complex subunit RsxG [Marinomonas gallaica]MCO4786246.1 electron transport complex subunit RsxG [Marinomonas atlantica]SBT18183.1 Electron transport complex protein RnfG [Marinomonas gallaica]SBT22563.1 Electron transport complex protein RnfG [Marinomonas gallaica]
MNIFTSIRQNSVGLGLFAVLTAGLIALTHQLTEHTIEDNIVQAQLSAFNEILPADRYDNNLAEAQVLLPADPLLGSSEPVPAFIARKDGQVTAIIFETIAPGGYNGNLDLLVAIDRNGVVTGSRVISHKETPGLGDKVDLQKSQWILSFAGKSLENTSLKQWNVKKDGGTFDQFTGATITPRAVVRAVKNTLLYFNENQDALLSR